MSREYRKSRKEVVEDIKDTGIITQLKNELSVGTIEGDPNIIPFYSHKNDYHEVWYDISNNDETIGEAIIHIIGGQIKYFHASAVLASEFYTYELDDGVIVETYIEAD